MEAFRETVRSLRNCRKGVSRKYSLSASSPNLSFMGTGSRGQFLEWILFLFAGASEPTLE